MKRKLLRLLPWPILIIATVFYISTKRNDPQLQPSTTVTSFVVALVRNDKQVLGEIVVPQQQGAVSEWLSSHQRFFCPPGLDFPSPIHKLEYTRFITQRARIYQNFNYSNSASFNAFYGCAIDINSDRGLNFEVYDILLERQGDKWYVTSWRFRCESKRLNGCG